MGSPNGIGRRATPGSSVDIATPRLIGESPEIREVLRQIDTIARSTACVLIYGETGAGKELAARAIHAQSDRRDGPFVAVNCGALPDGVVERELFGHGRGAFTDAGEPRPGVIALAERGSLFLDEVDSLSPKAQVTLLRFLQDLRYRPLGTTIELTADVRVIAAAHQDLQPLVDAGAFRRDLLYRLNVLELWLPPLRSRPADIEPLANHFIQRFSAMYGCSPKRLHPAAVAWLHQHAWPGNVRELENWVHRHFLLADGDEIVNHLSPEPAHGPWPSPGTADLRTAKAKALAEFERAYLARVLAEAGGNVTHAARLCGKERRALGKLLKKYGLDRARFQS